MEATKNSPVLKLELDTLLLKKGALVLRAINHKLRQQLMKYLYEKGESTATDIYLKFNMEQTVASQHLKILRQSGFVNKRRDGKYIYYFVNDQRIKEVHDTIGKILETKE